MFRADDANTSSNDDCYFYFYSTCKKAETCPFRHCEAALGTETVCSDWQMGKCYQATCSLRHMESQKDRSAIPCYWENQPGGCRKPHCVFRHYRLRKDVADDAAVANKAVFSDEQDSSSNSILSRRTVLVANKLDVEEDDGDQAESELLLPAVEPLVVNFDEESDSESCTSTPIKTSITSDRTLSTPMDVHHDIIADDLSFKLHQRVGLTRSLTLKKGGENLDFGIKTLQEIRREREVADQRSNDGMEIAEVVSLEADYMSVIPEVDQLHDLTRERVQLLRPNVSKDLDFKIKTLEEIRKEQMGRYDDEDGCSNVKNLAEAKENNGYTNKNHQTIVKTDHELNEWVVGGLHEEVKNRDERRRSRSRSRRKRSTLDLYKPPKAVKDAVMRSQSPQKTQLDQKNLDKVRIKTLAEIREEKKMLMTDMLDGEKSEIQNQEPKPLLSAMKTETKNCSQILQGSPRKRMAAVADLGPFLSKKIHMASQFSLTPGQHMAARAAKFASKVATDIRRKEKPTDKEDERLLSREHHLEMIVLPSPLNSSCEKKCVTDCSASVAKEMPFSTENLCLATLGDGMAKPLKQMNETVEMREAITLSSMPITTVECDEFDLLLDSEDDDDVVDAADDVKEDDLLLELEEMINS